VLNYPFTAAAKAEYHDGKAMPTTVRLHDIVEVLEAQFDEFSSYLDLDTGQVESISNELLREPDLPDWEEEEWELAKRIVSTERFLELPSKFDVHEWSIMEQFTHSVESARMREDLLHAIHGAKAFRRFEDTVRRHNIEENQIVCSAASSAGSSNAT
jgi:hypothetical protein